MPRSPPAPPVRTVLSRQPGDGDQADAGTAGASSDDGDVIAAIHTIHADLLTAAADTVTAYLPATR